MDTADSKRFLYKSACPKCGSKDNLGVYADGHAYCFSPGCGHREPPKTHNQMNNTDLMQSVLAPHRVAKAPMSFLQGKPLELKSRGITLATCQRWGYICSTDEQGTPVQIAQHYDQAGNVVAQKVRYPKDPATGEKTFRVRGSGDALTLYGMHLWNSGGKALVVCEGEIDAMSIDQAFSGSVAVVSVPNGAQSARKFMVKHLEWVSSYEKVILAFDMDEAGRKAVEEVAPLLPAGKCHIAYLQMKDANEMLMAGRSLEMTDSIANAKQFRPDGIISGDDVELDMLLEDPAVGYDTPYPELNQMLRGIRKGELTLVTAGTGVGKSTIVREIGYHFNVQKQLSIGNIFLEEGYKKTVQGYIAIDQNIRLGDLRQNPKGLSTQAYQESLARCIKNGRTFFYNHFGSLDANNLLSKIDFLAAQGVDFILLDHISMVVSGMQSSKEGERKDIDILMTKLRQAIEKTGVGVIAICHLVKNDKGQSHEEGGRVTLDDLRGSGTLKQIPDNIIAIERNQQGDNPDNADIRVLKNREFGDLGMADHLGYDKQTGRLLPAERQELQGIFVEPASPKVKPKKPPKQLSLKGMKARPVVPTSVDDDDDSHIPF